MKKPYQIGAGRAVQRVRQWAEEKNPTVQLMLPMIEILALAKQGAGELVREAGLRVIPQNSATVAQVLAVLTSPLAVATSASSSSGTSTTGTTSASATSGSGSTGRPGSSSGSKTGSGTASSGATASSTGSSGSSGYASCGQGAVLVGGSCVLVTCGATDGYLYCLISDGGVGQCLGSVCSAADFYTDPLNCGGLGVACPVGATCGRDFVCYSGGAGVSCQTAGVTCPAGLSCDTKSVLGTCDLAACTDATAGQACQSATNGQGFCCGTTCIGLLYNSLNCGTCGYACPGNAACIQGQCSTDCTTAPENASCYTGSLGNFVPGFCCNGACVANTNSDAENCGFCGAVCPTGATCANGACNPNCFQGGNCAAGQACLANACAPTSCGSSPVGTLCAALDPAGFPHAGSCCSSGCTNTQIDSENCGACGVVCEAGGICVSGICQPPSTCQDQVDNSPCLFAPGQPGACCSGSCIDIETDDSNCGACNLYCAPGTTCAWTAEGTGQCELAGAPQGCSLSYPCPAAEGCNPAGDCVPNSCTGLSGGTACYLAATLGANSYCCGGTCVDVASDSTNCDYCGVACPSGSTCASGQCVSPGTSTVVPCGPSAGCPAGTECVNQTCLPRSCSGLSTGDGCAYGVGYPGECCSGTCASTDQDPNNCGACGVVCDGGICQGTCTTNSPQSCDPACGPGETCVLGECSGPVCGSRDFCTTQDGQAGFCCGGGPGGTCLDADDFSSDPQNCGFCGLSCDGGACHNGTCQGSICNYANQGAYCGGASDANSICCETACVNSAVDNDNCGGCGFVCTAGKVCQNGVCQ